MPKWDSHKILDGRLQIADGRLKKTEIIVNVINKLPRPGVIANEVKQSHEIALRQAQGMPIMVSLSNHSLLAMTTFQGRSL